MSAIYHTSKTTSLLTLIIAAIHIETSDLLSCGIVTRAKAYSTAKREYGFTLEEFAKAVYEGISSGLIVEGCEPGTIGLTECSSYYCNEPATNVFESELYCHNCYEIALYQQ
jgi:hypothetical protein